MFHKLTNLTDAEYDKLCQFVKGILPIATTVSGLITAILSLCGIDVFPEAVITAAFATITSLGLQLVKLIKETWEYKDGHLDWE